MPACSVSSILEDGKKKYSPLFLLACGDVVESSLVLDCDSSSAIF